jgi:hypothetical protein
MPYEKGYSGSHPGERTTELYSLRGSDIILFGKVPFDICRSILIYYLRHAILASRHGLTRKSGTLFFSFAAAANRALCTKYKQSIHSGI